MNKSHYTTSYDILENGILSIDLHGHDSVLYYIYYFGVVPIYLNIYIYAYENNY
jgi:hypothetical protein